MQTSGMGQVGDVTYVWTHEGWVYLAVILDLFSRRVIGWAISSRFKQDLALRALNMAIAIRRPPPGCIQVSVRSHCSAAHSVGRIVSALDSGHYGVLDGSAQ